MKTPETKNQTRLSQRGGKEKPRVKARFFDVRKKKKRRKILPASSVFSFD